MSMKGYPIAGHPNYSIDVEGNIKNLEKGSFLSPSTDNNGYPIVKLGSGVNRKSHRVHRLLADNLLPGKFEKAVVNHKDGNPTNNSICNLEWVTQARNVEHGLARMWCVTLPSGDKIEVYNLAKFCRENNLNAGHMSEVAQGKVRKQHKGYKCKLKEMCK